MLKLANSKDLLEFDGGTLSAKRARGVLSLGKRGVIFYSVMTTVVFVSLNETIAGEGSERALPESSFFEESEGFKFAKEAFEIGDFVKVRQGLIGEHGELPNLQLTVYAALRNKYPLFAFAFRSTADHMLNRLESRINKLQSDIANEADDYCRSSSWLGW